jgi:hypothetical protein
MTPTTLAPRGSGCRLARRPKRRLGPVLIRVPAVPDSDGQPWRTPGPRSVAARRRLRREVRLIGLALLVGLPLGGALWGWGGGSGASSTKTADSSHAEPAASAPVEDLPVIFIPSPRAPTPAREARTPVVLPGYLLPDDGAEEPSHAGG